MSDHIYELADLEARRFLPPGKYAGVISGVVSGVTSKGTKTVRFYIRPEEPLSGQDLEGVELNVELKSSTFFDTQNAIGILADTVRAVNPSAVQRGTAMELAERIVGDKVKFDFIGRKERNGDRVFWECINLSAA
jgi:hypothetical protein